MPRYLAFTYPGQALVLTYLGYRVFGGGYSRVWAFLGVLLFAANPLILTRWQKGNDELLPVIRLVRAEPNAPVFSRACYSSPCFTIGVAEISRIVTCLRRWWRIRSRTRCSRYPPGRRMMPSYVDDMVASRLAQVPEVVCVDKDDRWEYWIRERMARAGFHATAQPAGHFKVFVFRK